MAEEQEQPPEKEPLNRPNLESKLETAKSTHISSSLSTRTKIILGVLSCLLVAAVATAISVILLNKFGESRQDEDESSNSALPIPKPIVGRNIQQFNLNSFISSNLTFRIRNEISPSIFEPDPDSEDYKDVFVFSGTNSYQLSKPTTLNVDNSQVRILQEEGADASPIKSNILNLNFPDDFDKLCKPERFRVHHVNYETSGTLKWIKSCNGMECSGFCFRLNRPLLSSVSDKVNDISFDGILSQSFSNKPIVITDDSQLEVPFILETVKLKLAQLFPKRNILSFTYTDLLNKLATWNLTEPDYPDMDTFIKSLTTILKTPNQNLNNEVTTELLIQDFDKKWNGIFKFYHPLKYIASTYKNVRLWVITRPQFKNDVESMLSILPFEVNHFNENELLELIANKWLQTGKIDNSNSGKLKLFALSKHQMLKDGIPPQLFNDLGQIFSSLLIAEIYEEEALKFAKTEESQVISNSKNNFNLNDLLQIFIFYKFKQVGSNLQQNKLLQMHYQLSLNQTFPKIYRETNFSEPVDIKVIMKAGLLVKTNLEENPKFLHNALSDYFISSFLIEALKTQTLSTNVLSTLFLKITETDSISSRLFFTNYRMCYFLNNFLVDFLNSDFLPYVDKILTNPVDELRIIADTAVHSNFQNIFTILQKVIELKNPSVNLFDKNTLNNAIRFTDLPFVKYILTKYKQNLKDWPPDQDTQHQILTSCILRSDAKILSYFLTELRFTTLNFPYLINLLITSTRKSSNDEIDSKIEIIDTLLKEKPDLLWDYSYAKDIPPPLLSSQVNIRILIHLLNLGADPTLTWSEFNQSKSKDTFLHWDKLDRPYNSEEIQQLLASIAEAKLAKLIKVRGELGETPLFRLIKHQEINSETFQIFYDADANFNDENDLRDSILATAMRKRRTPALIHQLIMLGADPKWRSGWGEGLLHLGAEYGNFEALKTLISVDFGLSINAKDERGNTPLHLGAGWGLDMVSFLLDQGANPTITSVRGETALSLALKHLDSYTSFNSTINLLACKMTLMGWKPSEGTEAMKIATQLFLRSNSIEWTECLENIRKVIIQFKPPSGGSLLHVGAEKRDLDLVQFLTRHGADVNLKDKEERTPLHVLYWTSCGFDWNSLLRITEYLLGHRAVVSLKDGRGDKFIHSLFRYKKHCLDSYYKATSRNFRDLIELLDKMGHLELFGDLGGGDSTPFEEALEVVELDDISLQLLSKSIDFRKRGGFIIGTAIREGRNILYIEKLIMFGADWRGHAWDGANMLHLSAGKSNLEGVRLFLKLGGINVNEKAGEGDTPLHNAVGWGYDKQTWLNMVPIFTLLVENGGSLNIKNFYGRTPLHIVARKWREEWYISNPILKFLIEKGADVYAKDKQDATFLHEFFRSTSMIVNRFNPDGFKVLETEELLQVLVKKNKMRVFNVKGGRDGATPFQLAVNSLELKEEMLDVLKENGVDFNAVDSNGDSVLKYAVEGGRSKPVLMKLIKLGANWKFVDKQGNDLLQIAITSGNAEAVEYFKEIGLGLGKIRI